MTTFVLFIILAIPGQEQPAVHREEIATLEECLKIETVLLHKAVEKKQLIQVGCIVVPPEEKGI